MLEIPTTHYIRMLSVRQLRYLHHQFAAQARASVKAAFAPYGRILHASGRLCEGVYIADRIVLSCGDDPEAIFVAFSIAISACDRGRVTACLDALKKIGQAALTKDQHARFMVHAALANFSVGNNSVQARALLRAGPVIQSVTDSEALYLLASLISELDDRELAMHFLYAHGNKGVPLSEKTASVFLKQARSELLEVIMSRGGQ